MSERAARAERLRPYFGLQLRLAERIAALRPMPLSEAVLEFTNLHRRFGLGRLDGRGPAPAWADFSGRLDRLATAEARLDWTMAFFEASPEEEALGPGQVSFGCFALDPPDTTGAARIHFYNNDSTDGVGPLAAAKAPARRAELRAMFAYLRAAYPAARTLRGGSWLYNLEAYRRLFPPAYVASRAPMAAPRLAGASTWGQLLRHDESVNAAVRDTLLANLDALDPTEPWAVFPYRAQVTSAPVEAFYGFYE